MAANSCVILSVPKRVHRGSPTKPAQQGNNCSESSGRKIVRARIGARLVPYANSKWSSAKCKLRARDAPDRRGWTRGTTATTEEMEHLNNLFQQAAGADGGRHRACPGWAELTRRMRP